MSTALRNVLYSCLPVAVIATLWAYAATLSSSTARLVMKPDRPMVSWNDITDMVDPPQPLARVAPWSLGDIDGLSS